MFVNWWSLWPPLQVKFFTSPQWSLFHIINLKDSAHDKYKINRKYLSRWYSKFLSSFLNLISISYNLSKWKLYRSISLFQICKVHMLFYCKRLHVEQFFLCMYISTIDPKRLTNIESVVQVNGLGLLTLSHQEIVVLNALPRFWKCALGLFPRSNLIWIG